MKKLTSCFFILSLMLSLNIFGQVLGLNWDNDNDNLASIECKLYPIERKSFLPCHWLNEGQAIQGSESSSINWSGYAAFTGTSDAPNPTYNTVSKVFGSWIVPTVVPSEEGDTFSAAWLGIDGYINSVVEQIGTEHDVINGKPNYYAWFSLYPAPTQLIDGFPVNPGDVMEGKVSYKGQDGNGNDVFSLTIKNRTQKVKFSTIQHTLPGNPAHLSSAEWIVEAPGIVDPRIPCLNLAFLPLANFDTIFFQKCEATINGRTGSIKDKHWTFDAITMISNGIAKAIPSSLKKEDLSGSRSSKCNGSSSFSVAWASSGPFPYQVYCPPIVP
jgi:hypothetical protein